MSVKRDLRPLFEPSGVVVVGASSHPGKFGFVALHNILACGYEGAVYATNPDAPEILGVQTLARVSDLPDGEVDLAMVCAPARFIPQILKDAASKGVRAAFIVSGGYRETDQEGAVAEQELVALAEDLGMVLAGPNGQGLVSTPQNLASQIVAPYPPSGKIGIASQSGNLVSTIMNLARQSGVGISRAVSAGNQAMLGVADYLRYLGDDDETSAVIVYVEGVADGRDFYDALRSTTPRKPVVVVKGGVTESGAAAAASHTGSLASDDRVFDGMLRQAGALRAPAIDVAYSWAATFATQPLPAGPNTVVLTTAGGWGVLTADALAASSLELMMLPTSLSEAIGELVPPRWSRSNPVDLAGGETRDTIPRALDVIAAHPDVDAVVYLGLGIQGNTARAYRESPFSDEGMDRTAAFHERQEARYAKSAVEVSKRHSKPIIVATELGIGDPDNPGPATMRSLGGLCHSSPLMGVSALDAMWRYASGSRGVVG